MVCGKWKVVMVTVKVKEESVEILFSKKIVLERKSDLFSKEKLQNLLG